MFSKYEKLGKSNKNKLISINSFIYNLLLHIYTHINQIVYSLNYTIKVIMFPSKNTLNRMELSS